jgi:carboxyl-terminal processing protease
MIDTLRAFFLVGAVFAGGLLSGAGTVRSAFSRSSDAYAGLDTYALALNKVEQVYVEEVDGLALVHASIRGMVDTLDPHSLWLSPQDYKALQERADGRYLGIGVELGEMGEAEMVIDEVTPRGPAALAGVEPGDVLTAIDGQQLSQLTPEDVQALLAGSIGEPVELTLLRNRAEVRLTVIRDEVVDVSIAGELINGNIGYVRVEHFHRRAAAELSYAIGALSDRAELAGLILDLRDNPGGLITEAVEMVDLFVSTGTIVEVRRRDAEPEIYTASAGDELTLPLVVLINGGSASASELVAGALQDLGRATLIGSPTYGKGSMQHIYLFNDGSALKLTVARYYLPSGATIAPNIGLEPDRAVSQDSSTDDQLATLIAEIEKLSIPAEQRTILRTQLAALPLRPSPPTELVPRGGTIEERVSSDHQLSAAAALLRELGG